MKVGYRALCVYGYCILRTHNRKSIHDNGVGFDVRGHNSKNDNLFVRENTMQYNKNTVIEIDEYEQH